LIKIYDINGHRLMSLLRAAISLLLMPYMRFERERHAAMFFARCRLLRQLEN